MSWYAWTISWNEMISLLDNEEGPNFVFNFICQKWIPYCWHDPQNEHQKKENKVKRARHDTNTNNLIRAPDKATPTSSPPSPLPPYIITINPYTYTYTITSMLLLLMYHPSLYSAFCPHTHQLFFSTTQTKVAFCEDSYSLVCVGSCPTTELCHPWTVEKVFLFRVN